MIHDIRTNYMNKISQSYVFIHLSVQLFQIYFHHRSSMSHCSQPRPQGFFLKKWVGREKALASAGYVYSLNIPEKLIYVQPAGFALTEGSSNGK